MGINLKYPLPKNVTIFIKKFPLNEQTKNLQYQLSDKTLY